MIRLECKEKKGFTLVETLVAITILLIAIVGPMTAASRGLHNVFTARDQITATYLAQESIEQVYMLRDENALEEVGNGGSASATWQWYSDLPNGCKDGSGCDYDVQTDTFQDCGDIRNCNLYSSSTSGILYSYNDSGTQSPFTRVTKVIENPAAPEREAFVTVTVTWEGPPTVGLQEYIASTTIFNMYEGI